MKAAIVILLLIGGLLYAGYYATTGFDPTQQGKDAQAAIKPGMDSKKVLEIAGEPRLYGHYILKVVNIAGEEIEDYKPSVPIKFKLDRFKARLKEGEFEHGFYFRYQFSQKVAFDVNFDPEGKVDSLYNLSTMSTLLGTDDE